MSTYGPGSGFTVHDTQTPSGAWANPTGNVDVDNIRRKFGIGDYVAELSPEANIFFTYLSKVAKSPTDDTVWKPLEYRTQWQRRNFRIIDGGETNVNLTYDAATDTIGGDLVCKVNYDSKGKMNLDTTVWDKTPIFLLQGQVIRIKVDDQTPSNVVMKNFKVTAWDAGTSTATVKSVETWASDPLLAAVHDGDCQVVGSAFAEASGAPDGWRDELSSTEFYTQIFKTSVPLMSGSAMATKYRGYADEWKRIYAQHVMSHKMDIEHAMLFGHGQYVDKDTRYSWGVVPFIETQGGKIYDMSYNTHGFDKMVDIMQDFFAPEMGNSSSKLCLTSRSVIAWLSKIGSATSGSFMYNTYGTGMNSTIATDSGAANPYSVQVSGSQSKFAPVPITVVQTAFGTFNFVAHPLFRNQSDNLCAVIDMANIKYRPLSGNGLSRDTYVETNIQDNSIDGRKDQIITECGLELLLPETHALINFSS
tara:strand:+ start:29677 stop:31104 length:1428 start_codon:yes stop_codon:yes gene_type:complete